MTYGNHDVRSKTFSWPSPTCARIFIVFVLVLLTQLSSLPLNAASITYDPAGGSLSGFDMYRIDSPNNPDGNNYTSGQYDSHPGYLGRMVYVGAPTEFTFTNIGNKDKYGNTVSENEFYFYQQTNSDFSRKIFLVIKVWGLLRDTSLSLEERKVDIHNKCYVIVNKSDTYTLTEGAGEELADVNDVGFNEAGEVGTYTGNNEYKYLYRYSHIWIDVTVIHQHITWPTFIWKSGYYESHIDVSTNSGAKFIFHLFGSWGLTGSGSAPFSYAFSIDKYYKTPIFYNEIRNRNNKDTALGIASISYFSDSGNARIAISSDITGQNTDFFFEPKSGGEPFPFSLAFKKTIPAGDTVALTETNYFQATAFPHVDSKGKTTYTYELKGEIQLYTDANTPIPATGVYHSFIYVLVAPLDTT